MSILEQLQRLRLQPMEWADHADLRPINASAHLKDLLETTSRLVARRKQPPVSAAPMDCREAGAVWAASKGHLESLSTRQIRGLCRCPETALKPEFVRAITTHERASKATLWFASLTATYFEQWRTMANPDELEAALRVFAKKYVGRATVLRKYREHSAWLFSPRSADELSDRAFSARLRISDVLSEWGIPAITGLSKAVAGRVVGRWVRNWDATQGTITEASALAELHYLTNMVLGEVSGEPLYQAMEAMVMRHPAARYETVKKTVREYVIGKLGDPRLPQHRAAWGAIPSEVRQRVLSWLAKEYLLFFFDTVLPSADDDHGRKEFWLAYCHKIVDFTVVLSRRDVARVKTHMANPPPYARLDEDTLSAFIMRFTGSRADVVIVEFSEPGNAAYIHSTPLFEKAVGTLHTQWFKKREQLRHESHVGRIVHRSGWQYRGAAQLAEYGIR